MRISILTGLVALAMMLGAVEVGNAQKPTLKQCQTPSDYAQMIKTGRC